MALGKVESIDPTDSTKGTIKEDETEQVYPFVDPNFPNTGLKVGDPCTYDIDYTARQPQATNLQPYTPTEVVISTPVTGNYTVNTGETLRVGNGGKITGSVVVNNGNLYVQGTGEVNGPVTIDNQGSAIARNGGKITGSITVNNGSALKVVNGGVVRGNIDVAQANRVIIGNNNGGGNVYGELTVVKIRKVTITATSKFNC